ncbi:hypothetical protein K2Y11_05605 [bacterium]|nr:hypothetical protein [bacterium]
MDSVKLAQGDWAFTPQMKNLVIGLALLTLAVGISVAIVIWIRKKLQSGNEQVSPNDLLSEFRELRARGLMTEAEFNRVRGLLGNKLRQEAGQLPVDLSSLPPVEDEPVEIESTESEYEWEEVDLHPFDAEKKDAKEAH